MQNCRMVTRALSYYGTAELPGDKDNQVIMNFFHELGHEWVKHDETGWCSAFINYLAMKEHLPHPNVFEHKKALLARSWLRVGVGVNLDSAQTGDIVVFWRISKNGTSGHVALFVNFTNKNKIKVLGGNQSNQVKISDYPVNKILGIRRLI